MKENKPNKPIYVRKFTSSRLMEYDCNIDDSFEQSVKAKEIIGLFDNQILRTIREITKHNINRDKLDFWAKMKNFYKYPKSRKVKNKSLLLKSKLTKEELLKNESELSRLGKIKKQISDYYNNAQSLHEYKHFKQKIDNMMFIPQYIVVKMDTKAHYRKLYKKGFMVNGRCYKRLSCSAGQARVSTVVFCDVGIIDEVKSKLNNGRNVNQEFSPSKFNAYFGLYGSATKLVTEPRFIVIKDYENKTSFKANFVTENKDKNADDTVDIREIKDEPMNRTDGMGLISPEMAKQWANDLSLDYVPAQFCIRQSFLKGMLCVFDIHEFCEEINGGNYIVDTIYKDVSGNYVKADLRECDVIITESQFKLWDSYESLESYIINYRNNNLKWGVSLYTPKEANPMMKLNYQFIQTLNLSQSDIEKLASPFIDWISGVSYDNVYYMLLFLLGVNNTDESIQKFLSGSDKYWIKSLLLNHELKNDKYIRTRIRELIKNKIKSGCKGDIYVDGNFQVIVSDPYGFMQHVCGLEVTGLLGKDEYYSNYWNKRNIDKVDAMRSPLTYMSEHVILNLRNDTLVNKWYQYCDLGIILNYHGHETVNFAGADFDFDILATVSSLEMINGVYKKELPVVYNAPKPKKWIFSENDLYKSDTFSFGTKIGDITNKSSNGYSLLTNIEEDYGVNSNEYKLLKSRLQQCCVAQSKQIDKTKIGAAVKGIPSVWIKYNKLPKEGDKQFNASEIETAKLHNATLLDRHPYFFRYLYDNTKKKYSQYVDSHNQTCQQLYGKSLNELGKCKKKTPKQTDFIDKYNKYCPVIMGDSPMNLLCKYIESIDFQIASKTKSKTGVAVYELLKNTGVNHSDYYSDVIHDFELFLEQRRADLSTNIKSNVGVNTSDDEHFDNFKDMTELLYSHLTKIYKNVDIIVNCLVDYYSNKPITDNKILWETFGKVLFRNVKRNSKKHSVLFPFPTSDATKYDVQYLGVNYKLKEVII